LVLFVNSRLRVQNLQLFEGMLDLKTYKFPSEIDTAEPEDDSTAEREPLPLQIRVEPRPPLPVGVRIGIFIVGWLLILVGVAGLVLPGIQGIATILIGAALLSLDNELVYRGLRRGLARWPKVWRRVEHFREKAHDRIHRMFHRAKK
jgi:hypothetical protein